MPTELNKLVAYSTLASDIASGVTSLTVAAGTGSRFPTAATGVSQFRATLIARGANPLAGAAMKSSSLPMWQRTFLRLQRERNRRHRQAWPAGTVIAQTLTPAALVALITQNAPTTFAASAITSGQLLAARGGTGVDGSAAGNGNLLIGNGSGFSIAALAQGANASVSITNGAGTITIDAIQDIRTSAAPTFAGQTLTGQFVNSLNGAASTPAAKFTGTIFTGGNATTTKPLVLVEPTGTTSAGWATTGTLLGVQRPKRIHGTIDQLPGQRDGKSLLRLLWEHRRGPG